MINLGHVQLETVVTDGTHYDTMEHVSQEDLTRFENIFDYKSYLK
jgi:hypothetical protein